jgi:hypothetical protein
MSEHTTRIDQLPENVTMQVNAQDGMGSNEEGNANYAPMNIHPNPYGNSLQPHDMPMPQTSPPKKDSGQGDVNYSQQQREMIDNTPRTRLPSRDLPMDTETYLHDEEITANYIPKVRFSDDYVRDYEEVTTEKILQRENAKRRDSYVDRILSDLQVPILISMLYFLFQLPLINTMFFKRFAFLSIYNVDGNINFYGIALKSTLFGSLFYMLQKTVNVLTDF